MNVHLYPSELKNESRILKIARSLSSHRIFSEIVVIGRSSPGLPLHEDLGGGIHFYRLPPCFSSKGSGFFSKLFRTLGWYFSVIKWMISKKVECLNCHSLPVLPLSVLLKAWKRCVLVYDTHELETETNGLTGFRQLLAKHVELTLIRYADAVCVVSSSIAAWYKSAYKLKNVWAVHNMPPLVLSEPERTGLLRASIGLQDSDALLYIYQGVLAPGRGVELLLEVFSGMCGPSHLVFMGYGTLENVIRDAAKTNNHIHFVPAVSPDMVKDYTVDADIGFALMENNSLSNFFSAPNKLYEYIAYGVVPIVSDFPDMAQIVDEADCGWKVQPNFAALTELIKGIDKQTLQNKRCNTLRHRSVYSWENTEVSMLQMYDSLGLIK